MSGKLYSSLLDPNGIIANATENPLNLDGDDASLLDEFFAEIESLKIHDENDDEEEEDGNHQVESEKDGTNTGIIEHPRSLCGRSSPQKEKEQHQKSMIDRAESTKDNWKTFTIAETSAPQSISITPKRSSLTANGRKPISFSLGVGVGTESTKKKKKKKQNTQSKITRRQRQETESGQPCLGFGFDDETSSSTSPSPSLSPSPRRRDPPMPLSHPNHHLLPQWIAVLDTCAILESYESVCAMILLAKEAAAATGADSSHFLHQHPASRAFVSEALTIVVPYTVWDELDYRSKEIDDEHQRYKARRAARMLTEELRREQHQENAADRHHHYHQSQTQTHPIGESWFERDSIRSQSRIESHRAVEEFVLLLTSSPSSKAAASMDGIANNDDKILACALYEQNRLMKARPNTNVNSNATEPNDDATTIRRRAATAGGVVLITSDKVLTGKARADRLSVYSSSEFVRYYNKRMASLRSRAAMCKTRLNSAHL